MDWQCWLLEQQRVFSTEQLLTYREDQRSCQGLDLFGMLEQRRLLNPQMAQSLRQQLADYQAQNRGPTENGGALGPHPQESKEESCVKLLGQVLEVNPWFEPHGDWLWERSEKIGAGGMGVVYRARDQRLGRDAALKLLLTQDDPGALRRFIREVKVTACLDHPAIPPVYEAGKSAQGEHYMVMKLIAGQTLAERIQAHWDGTRNKEEPRDLLEALLRVSEALSYAHSQGIVHRDLKPENIMIGQFGEVLVLDWGIAKDLKESGAESDEHMTSAVTIDEAASVGVTVVGAMIGTPGYMAPEQIEGSACPQSDVFALGVLLVEIVTGEESILGDSVLSKVAATATGHYRFPRDIRNWAPRELDSLSRAALVVDLNERLSSAQSFTENLQAYLAGKPVPVHRYSLLEKAKRFVAGHPGFFVVLLVLVILCSSAAVLFVVINQSERATLDAQSDATEARVSEARVTQAFQRLNKLDLLLDRGASRSQFFVELESVFELGGRDNYGLVLLAAKLCGKGGYDGKARDLLKSAVYLHPKAYEALFLLHELELKETPDVMFRKTEALLQLDRRRRQFSDVNEFTLMIDAVEFFEAGKYKDALIVLSSLEEYSKSFAFGYCYRGTMKSKLGDLDGAMADYLFSLKIKPDYGHAYYNCGVIAQKRKQRASAIKFYDQAIKFSPSHAKALCNRGLLRERNKDLTGALEDYSAAHKSDPKLVEALTNRSRLWEKRKEYAKAKRDLDLAIQLRPKRSDSYVDRGNLSLAQGRYARALADFNRAIQFNPKNPRAYRRRAYLHRLRKRVPEAIEDYGRAIDLDKKDGQSYYFRAYLNLGRKARNDVLNDFNKAEKYGYRTANLYLNRGYFLVGGGDKEAGAADYERFLKLKPDYKIAEKLRAFIQENLGRKSRY
ncbi:MAG: tetratricopeptide repeat protein [Planctomycetota bacterium]|nr:tetratricopeptide repeat protein [Planctomycetota bacterium]